MAVPIEEQIHQHFVALENERAAAANRKARPVAKPWARLHPQALCQEPDLLQLVKEYGYDLTDERFQEYCRARGVLHVAGVKGSRRWEFLKDYGKSKEEYLADPFFQYAQEHEGACHKYTERELESGWQILELSRAALQDCWELYQAGA